MMPKDFKDLLRLLNANAAKYVIIGGHAFGVHAIPRTTKDLDLFIQSDPENATAGRRKRARPSRCENAARRGKGRATRSALNSHTQINDLSS